MTAVRSDADIVVTFYTSEADFLAATSSTTLVNFEGIVDDDANSAALPALTIGNVIFSAPGEVFVAGANSPTFGSPFESAILATLANSPLTATLADDGTGYTAVGGYFDSLGADGNSETLTLIGTTGVLGNVTVTAGTLESGTDIPYLFFGFTVTGDSIVSITSSLNTDNSEFGDFAGLDDFRYGMALSSVPEPSSLAMLGLAGSCLLARLRMKRRRSLG